MASTRIGKQAVVIGAGMGGLAAAGALADRFDQVVVLERDTLPSGVSCGDATGAARACAVAQRPARPQ
jgi:glycine/D-amino acid oxidase-like deaminating enzyme